ncbi:MAG: class F420-dependent oxidoreductase [Nocardioidaceae bacterium]|nr:class F420-dependent oxidoreductase [Nocardioidaceae bacterium]
MVRPFVFSVPAPRFTGDAAAWRDGVREIEDLGIDAVSISDHFTNGWVLEPVVAMTVAAEATSRLGLVSLVLGNDYRHPVLLHKAMATLDAMSGGRVTIGLGAGWSTDDYGAAGIPLDPPGVRVDRLAESLAVLRGLFGEAPFSFDGEHYRISDLQGLPAPVRPGGPTFLVGGGGSRVLGVAGRYADVVGINARLGQGPVGLAVHDLSPDQVATKIGHARAGALASGRDPDELTYQVNVLAVDVSDVPGATPWRSSMASGLADIGTVAHHPVVLRGSLNGCAEHVLRGRETFGITHLDVGGDRRVVAALAQAVRDQA